MALSQRAHDNVPPADYSSTTQNLPSQNVPLADYTLTTRNLPSQSRFNLALPRTADGRRRQASMKNVSRFDFAELCDSYYHGGPDGLPTLSMPDIQACCYTTINFDDVVLCFNDIIGLHAKVLAT